MKNVAPVVALILGAFSIVAYAAFWLAVLPTHAGEPACGLKASWYGLGHHGRLTASGAVYDQWGLSAAHMTAAFGTRFRVTYGEKSVVVTVNDRGNFAKYGRTIDLSRGAFRKLAPEGQGVLTVCLERLS